MDSIRTKENYIELVNIILPVTEALCPKDNFSKGLHTIKNLSNPITATTFNPVQPSNN